MHLIYTVYTHIHMLIQYKYTPIHVEATLQRRIDKKALCRALTLDLDLKEQAYHKVGRSELWPLFVYGVYFDMHVHLTVYGMHTLKAYRLLCPNTLTLYTFTLYSYSYPLTHILTIRIYTHTHTLILYIYTGNRYPRQRERRHKQTRVSRKSINTPT